MTKVLDIVQDVEIETFTKKKKSKKVKCLSEEAFQITEERRKTKGKGESD